MSITIPNSEKERLLKKLFGENEVLAISKTTGKEEILFYFNSKDIVYHEGRAHLTLEVTTA